MEYLNATAHVQDYVLPLFGVSTDGQLVTKMTAGVLLYAFIVLVNPMPAPYGRHSQSKFGFGMPATIAWVIQECPSFFVPVLLVVTGSSPVWGSLTNLILLGMFVVHYFHRSLVYPFLVRSSNAVPFLPFFFAFLTCLYNGVLHGVYFAKFQLYEDHVWLSKSSFWLGVIVYLCGMALNISADTQLRRLRGAKGAAYVVPRGSLFALISCPNYLGEVVQMWGYALASQAPPAVAHAIFSSCFLGRRALQHHQWYLKKFEDYPKDRRAFLPYLL